MAGIYILPIFASAPTSKLTDAEKLMIGLLTNLSEKEGYCYATNEYLGEQVGKSTDAAQKLIERLNKKELIRIDNKSRKGQDRKIYINFAERLYNDNLSFNEVSNDNLSNSNDNLSNPYLYNNKEIIQDTATSKTIIQTDDTTTKILNINQNQNSFSKSTSQTQNSSKLTTDDFLKWWEAYPRKVAKSEAERKFLKISEVGIDTLMSALEKQKASKQWQQISFIPNPTTWINQKRWEDETVVIENHLTPAKKISNAGGDSVVKRLDDEWKVKQKLIELDMEIDMEMNRRGINKWDVDDGKIPCPSGYKLTRVKTNRGIESIWVKVDDDKNSSEIIDVQIENKGEKK